MPDGRQDTSVQPQDGSKREERAQRILDVAAALILRWGYNKTTIDDIARQAGVAKGTIYLHWKTREELFGALMQRERLALTEEVQRRVAADPAGATLRAMLRHSALALLQRPLLKAALLRDAEVIGRLAHSAQNSAALAERAAGFATYLAALREQGLVRTDLSLRTQVFLVSAAFAGFFLVAPLLPDDYRLTDEELADLLAETVHRTLEPERTAGSDLASQAVQQYLDRDAAIAREQLRQGLAP